MTAIDEARFAQVVVRLQESMAVPITGKVQDVVQLTSQSYIDYEISTKVCEDKEKSPSREQLGEKEGNPKVIFPASDLARLLKPNRYCIITA